MAAFIKRILKNKRTKHQGSWADNKERQQFEREQQNWKSRWLTIL